MKIVVSGSTGLIGSALVEVLRQRDDEVIGLVRRRPGAGEPAIAWDPERGSIDRPALERAGADTVIHLAGENVFGRWSPAKKHRISGSRVLGTRVLTDALAGLARPPAALLAASAIGYYGDRGEEELSEQSAPGEDFLAHVCRDWEAATAPATRAGIRVVNMRMGVVLTTTGGALAKMLPAFRLGLGGPIGSGNQYVSWIARSDAIAAILHVLLHADLVGPVNMTAPHPVSSREFARTLGRVLGRPAVVTVPAFALRMAFGSDSAALLQSGQRVLPARLLASGFKFSLEALEPALRHLLAPSERVR
ncbi:MAG: TIGR01777 family protein [Gemmatimonadetes bacterium]|nr:MAG: TIGR01777 family protein [Gemmatimonadota bacterium]